MISTYALVAGMLFMLSACDVPSYPKEKLPEVVKTVCQVEYNMDVDVTVRGATMGIYYPMEGLLDVGLGISEDAWETIGNLLLIASRVVLSTDADIQFYCVITQDVRLPEIQIVIIKYVEDVKKGMYRNISRGEAFKRTLFSMNLTPQAKKERSIEKVFEKMGVDESTRKNVLDDFFRSPPTKLSDIGYWRGNFYLKNITIQEFIASQIANRVKLEFRGDGPLKDEFKYEAAEGSFISKDDAQFFLIKFKIADQVKEEGINIAKIREVLDIAQKVVTGYKFRDFGYMIMVDQLENARLKVTEPNVYEFNKKRTNIQEVVQSPSGYFQ